MGTASSVRATIVFDIYLHTAPESEEPIVAKLESGLCPRSVLVQLGFQPNAGLRIFYRRTFLEESQHVLLAKGETLFVFPPGGVRPPLRLLPDMLRRVDGWQVPLTAPRGLLQSAFNNSSPYRCVRWHCSHTARVNVPAQLLDGGEDLRCFLAGVLRGDALKKFLCFVWPPRVRELCVMGQPCLDALIVIPRFYLASRALLRSWRLHAQVPFVLDLHAIQILRSITWRLAPDGQIHLDALMGEFGPAPSGDYLEVGGGAPFSVGDRTYLRVDLLGDPPAPPETSSEDGSSDDGSGDSDGSADEPDPPRPPPPPTGSRNYRL